MQPPVGDGVLDVPAGKCAAFFGTHTELPLRGRVVEDADPYERERKNKYIRRNTPC